MIPPKQRKRLATEKTPGSSSQEVVSPSDGEPTAEIEQPDSEPPPPESIEFPFSHTGSIARNPNFCERSEVLSDIDSVFGVKYGSSDEEAGQGDQKSELSTAKTYVLCGMAGIGKTETACEYLYTGRECFDAVIWVYADTDRKLASQFVELAKELAHGAASDAMDEVSAREAVKAWLASPVGHRRRQGRPVRSEGRWLMIFDNADSPDILYNWLPEHGPGCVLVTGRYLYVRENAYRLGRGLDLEPFPLEVGGRNAPKVGRERRPA